MFPKPGPSILVEAAILLCGLTLFAQTSSSISFSAPKAIAVPSQAYTQFLASGDVNGDGKTDLLTQGGLLFGDGTGKFTPSSIDETAVAGSGLIPVPLTDLNGDGSLDAIQLIPGQYDPDHCDDIPDTVKIFLGDGHGDFAWKSSYQIAKSDIRSAVIGDFNNDGKPDVAFIGRSTDVCVDPNIGHNYAVISVLSNQGDGTFSVWIFGEYEDYDGDATTLVTGDFNKDGKPDLAFTGYSEDATGKPIARDIQVLAGNGDGTFALSAPYIYTLDSQPRGLAAADLNGDKRTDLVVQLDAKDASGAHPRIATLLAKQTTGFYWYSAVYFPTGSADSLLLTNPLIDFNRDGKLDLGLIHFVGIGAPSDLDVLAGEGGGNFAQPQSFPAYPVITGAWPLSLTTGGPADVLVQAKNGNSYGLGLLINQSK